MHQKKSLSRTGIAVAVAVFSTAAAADASTIFNQEFSEDIEQRYSEVKSASKIAAEERAETRKYTDEHHQSLTGNSLNWSGATVESSDRVVDRLNQTDYEISSITANQDRINDEIEKRPTTPQVCDLMSGVWHEPSVLEKTTSLTLLSTKAPQTAWSGEKISQTDYKNTTLIAFQEGSTSNKAVLPDWIEFNSTLWYSYKCCGGETYYAWDDIAYGKMSLPAPHLIKSNLRMTDVNQVSPVFYNHENSGWGMKVFSPRKSRNSGVTTYTHDHTAIISQNLSLADFPEPAIPRLPTGIYNVGKAKYRMHFAHDIAGNYSLTATKYWEQMIPAHCETVSN